MRNELTAENIDHYRTQGFVVIDDFLDTDELEIWRGAVDEAVAQRQNRKIANRDDEAGDGYYDKVFTQRLNLWMDHDGVRDLMLDRRLGEMAATLEGVDGIRIWHDQALIKQAWANPTGWHLDNPYWSFSSRHAISIWVALDDATPDNGCLYFIPGTHKEANWDNAPIGQNMGELFELYPQWASRRSAQAAMKAGACSFHNGLTAHGAGANMTCGLRRAMTCAYMPDGERYNGKTNVLPPDYVSTLNEGDVLQNDAQNPLLYHVSKPCPATDR